MKLLLSLGVVATVVVGALMFIPSKTEVVKQEPQVVEKKVEVDALEQSIKSAQDAKKAEIQSIADKAWQEAYDQEMKKVELQVVTDFTKKLDARQESLEGELSL